MSTPPFKDRTESIRPNQGNFRYGLGRMVTALWRYASPQQAVRGRKPDLPDKGNPHFQTEVHVCELIMLSATPGCVDTPNVHCGHQLFGTGLA